MEGRSLRQGICKIMLLFLFGVVFTWMLMGKEDEPPVVEEVVVPTPDAAAAYWRKVGVEFAEEIGVSWFASRIRRGTCPPVRRARCTKVAEKFSVVIPAHIDQDSMAKSTWPSTALERVVQSLANQERYCPAEVIFVLSNVSSHRLATELRSCLREAFKASRILSELRILVRPGIHFAGANRNAGADAATRPFIVLSDGDDMWHPHKMEHLVNTVDEETLILTHTFLLVQRNSPWVPANWNLIEPPTVIDHANTGLGLIRPNCSRPACYYACHGHAVVRRSIWNATRPREDLRLGEDAEFLVRAYRYWEARLPADTKFFRHINASLIAYFADWQFRHVYIAYPLSA
ncbi:uncharacterized protein MONBRDRAFT_37033 [Monosiga brevicollis MX1]|uniref:Glycosyltransferase 2-like domain-containing protein n=1 Tax=Monosiga brevicollis TaxID=81824 RepID=A9UZ62_MONBE|nr:uncharacterized protein MONBRDRAFT_37033 [Monosiga brevicollis MX1]EDQ89310.1 predicted protein [Monosiga brevicollis MX1]|eukprot:XP_001745886.1 hypothetical protein [Monosiga brevicollis MX1]